MPSRYADNERAQITRAPRSLCRLSGYHSTDNGLGPAPAVDDILDLAKANAEPAARTARSRDLCCGPPMSINSPSSTTSPTRRGETQDQSDSEVWLELERGPCARSA